MQTLTTSPTASRSLFNQNKYLRFTSLLRSRLKSLQYQYNFHKSSSFVSRRNYDLYHLHVDILNFLLESFKHILLDNNYLICNTLEDRYRELYSFYKLLPSKLEDHCILLFGSYSKPILKELADVDRLIRFRSDVVRRGNYSLQNDIDQKLNDANRRLELIQNFQEILKCSSQKARTDYLKKRLLYEANHRITQGWYPFLVTLTVNDYNYDKVFSADSTVWTDYVRKFDRDVGIHCHGSWRNALTERKKGNEFHTYFAVVERGSQTGRLHIHVLHFIRELHASICDPNLGASQPINRHVTYFNSIWPYGHVLACAVRTGPFDSFSKKGWRWPSLRLKNGIYQPLKSSPINATVNYVAKYITKQNHDNLQKEGISWRTRMTRNLGMMALQMIFQKTPTPLLRRIIKSQRIPVQLLNLQIPKTLILRQATISYMTAMNKRTPKNFSRLLLVLDKLPLKENIFKSFRNVINNEKQSSPQNSGIIEMSNLSDTDISNLQSIIDSVSSQLFTNINLFTFDGSTSDYIGV